MTAAAFSPFLAGLVIGVTIGSVLGPLIRYWLAWRMWVEVSREDDLTDRMQKHVLDELEHLLVESPEADDKPGPEHPWSSWGGRTGSEPGKRSQRFGRRRSGRWLGAEKPRT